jgi:hypothetical protein
LPYHVFIFTVSSQAEIIKKYKEVDVPQFLTYFENLLKSNGGGDGYFVGNKVGTMPLQLLS